MTKEEAKWLVSNMAMKGASNFISNKTYKEGSELMQQVLEALTILGIIEEIE